VVHSAAMSLRDDAEESVKSSMVSRSVEEFICRVAEFLLHTNCAGPFARGFPNLSSIFSQDPETGLVRGRTGHGRRLWTGGDWQFRTSAGFGSVGLLRE